MLKAEGLEYELNGDGEAVLLIHGALVADALLPLAREATLADRYRLIRYRRRGHGGSDPLLGAFSLEQQAQDAAALLTRLGVERAHVIGHSGGGAIAVQLAIDSPSLVHSLVVLEPAIMPAEILSSFGEMAAPVLEAYRAGDSRRALDLWMNLVSCGPDWQTEVANAVPGAMKQTENDASTFFEVELPTIPEWVFDGERCRRISQPVLYLSGGESGPLIEAAKQHFKSLIPRSHQVVVPGANHLMQMRDAKSVAAPIADFLSRHPL
jgi:pimeloyl-ACP methyl ester carboxylesterase